MHDCIECEGACDCDGEDTWNDAATEECEGCGCIDDPDYDYFVMMMTILRSRDGKDNS